MSDRGQHGRFPSLVDQSFHISRTSHLALQESARTVLGLFRSHDVGVDRDTLSGFSFDAPWLPLRSSLDSPYSTQPFAFSSIPCMESSVCLDSRPTFGSTTRHMHAPCRTHCKSSWRDLVLGSQTNMPYYLLPVRYIGSSATRIHEDVAQVVRVHLEGVGDGITVTIG